MERMVCTLHPVPSPEEVVESLNRLGIIGGERKALIDQLGITDPRLRTILLGSDETEELKLAA